MLQKLHKIEDIVHLVNQYNVSCITMGQIPLEGLVMAKRQVVPRTCEFWGGMWPYAI